MAVGDIITNRGSSFVPAVGVEIIVFNSFTNNINANLGLQDGVNIMSNQGGVKSTTHSLLLQNRLGLTNTWYYYNNQAAGGFTGVQTK